jgi:UPF0271 protein
MLMINCDLGECLNPSPDADIMPFIAMANIACGGHIGDNQSMLESIRLAQKNQVKICAHPSYVDWANFGRVRQHLSPDELYQVVHAQVANFAQLCEQNNAKLECIKPHGALYYDVNHHPEVLGVMAEIIHAIDPNLSLIVQAGNEAYLEKFAKNNNLSFLREVFADRGYRGFELIPRGEKGALLDNREAIIKQFRQFSKHPTLKIDTICFHGDNPASIDALKHLKNA